MRKKYTTPILCFAALIAIQIVNKLYKYIFND